jgi:hypothetical protein
MAKASRQANARISTTVNARYYPTDNVNDGFFLDGRFPGKREGRAADITLDREDRGSLFAIYGRPESEDVSWQGVLTDLSAEAKDGTRAIDESFNTLAESAIQVTGRTTLGDGGREPYFAGIIVQDGEAAAVTLGDGGAYLYRRDALYALTNDDFPLEPIDFNGNPIEVVDEFAAGSAGTVRYSNIINLEQSDSLIVCNRALLAAIGQREFLRILNEAEDANEAAGLIVTQASAKSPGIPMQIVIAFINYIVPLEKRERLNLGRFATGMLNTDAVRAATADDSAKTQTFARKEISEYAAKAAAAAAPYSPEDEYDSFVTAEMPPVNLQSAEAPTKPVPQAPSQAPSIPAEDPYASFQPPRRGVTPGSDTDRYSKMAASSFGQNATDDFAGFGGATGGAAATGEVDYSPRKQSRFGGGSKAARDGFAAASERYKLAAQGPATAPPPPERPSRLGRKASAYQAHSGRYRDHSNVPDYADYNDYDGDIEDKNKVKRIIFFVLLGLIIVISLYALIRLLVGTGDTPKTTAPQASVTVTEALQEITPPPVQTETEAAEPTVTAEAGDEEQPGDVQPTPEVTPDAEPPAAGEDRTYIVEAGDNWWVIAMEFYDEVDASVVDALAAANGKTQEDWLYEGEELIIPAGLTPSE